MSQTNPNLIPRLKPFLHEDLDVLFVALNPPRRSNTNGHWFSGENSRFFKLLFESGLFTVNLPKAKADVVIFGMNVYNFEHSDYGVVDLVPDQVETESNFVRARASHFDALIGTIRQCTPKIVCIIHSDVKDAFNKKRNAKRHNISGPVRYGVCGKILANSDTQFYLNYFPNGNNIEDSEKLHIFRLIKDDLSIIAASR
jgi:G:T/U-mismatch repair DNA glycosylase